MTRLYLVCLARLAHLAHLDRRLTSSVLVTLIALAGPVAAQRTPHNELQHPRPDPLAHEPPVEQVVAAALAHAGLARSDDPHWERRARLSALAPRVSLVARHTAHRDEELASATHSQLDVDFDERRTVEARLVWDLRPLVFDPAELSAARRRSERVEQRAALAARVTALYYRRRRAQIALLWDSPMDMAEQARHVLVVEELTAQLDAYTDGAFSRSVVATGGGSAARE